MITPKISPTGMNELRTIVKQVPTELRNLARTERREIQKIDIQHPGTASYVMSRGGLENNAKLNELIKTLKSKTAETFYQRQPIGTMAEKADSVSVVKADMIL